MRLKWLGILGLTTLLGANPQCLMQAYVDTIKSANEHRVILKNDITFTYRTSSPKSTWDEKIAGPAGLDTAVELRGSAR